MKKLAIYFAGEWYIQCGFTELRSITGEKLQQEPKFLKTTLSEIKQDKGTVLYRGLKDGCKLEEIGFSVPRISDTEFGEKEYFYGVNIPEQSYVREKSMAEVSHIFAENFRKYINATRGARK